MKVYKNLFTQMVSMENLLSAWDEFRKGKRERVDVQRYEFSLEDNLFRLQETLVSKTYRHHPYTSFYIKDPKVRHIHKAEVEDRIVHHVLSRQLTAIFEPTFIHDSYSCRKGKGTHKAVRRLKRAMNTTVQTHGRGFVLKCDIEKFFPSIDHGILMDLIAKRVKDPDVLWLVALVIGSFASDYSRPGETKGAPIGNLTSQLFANLYLNELDQFVKQRLKAKQYLRYTDDFVIVHHDPDYLAQLKGQISDFLRAQLKLSLHPRKVEIRKYRRGIDFLGYVTLPHARVLRTTLRRRLFKKLRARIRAYKRGDLTEQSLRNSIASYLGILSHGNCYELELAVRHKLWEWLHDPTLK